MLSVLRKELEYKVEKLKYREVEGHATEDQNFQLVNKPSPDRINPHEVFQSWLIHKVYHDHLLVKNN